MKKYVLRYVLQKQKKKSPENAVFSGLFWRAWEDSNLWPSESECIDLNAQKLSKIGKKCLF